MQQLKTTTVFDKLVDAFVGHDLVVSYGGSSSSKTISALQLYTVMASNMQRKYFVFVAKSVPILKRNLIKDWKTVVMGDAFDDGRWNATDRVYKFDTGSEFHFVQADDSAKLLGFRADYYFYDECNTYQRGVFFQTFARSKGKSILSFNPDREFWISDVMKLKECKVIHSTFKDNQYLPTQTVKNLTLMAEMDPNFKKVYLDGQFGLLEGRVFSKVMLCDAMPETYAWQTVGIDFGWSHPLAVIHCRLYDNALYFNEVLYGQHLDDSLIAPAVKSISPDIVAYCDEAYPRDIRKLRTQGVTALGYKKKTKETADGSVKFGLRLMNQYPIFVTKRSVNLFREMTNYEYMKDKDGNFIDTPLKKNDDSVDAARYACVTNLQYTAYET